MRRGIMTVKRALLWVGCVAGGIALSAPAPALAQAETTPVAQSCDELSRRHRRQSDVNRGYACGLGGAAWSADRAPIERLARSCDADARQRLARLVQQRASALEICLAQRLEAANARVPETSQWAHRDAPQPDAAAARERAGIRPAGTRDDGKGQAATAPLASDAPGLDDAAARAQSAQRVRDLLARSPTPDTKGVTPPASIVREFRPGLTWSYGGAIKGMHCTKWEEPSDPNDWYDNYLCSTRDLGFKWSFRGPIQGRGLKCIQVNEPSDPHFWHDNYFCWPRDLKVTFRFSATGRIPGLDCLAIVEPSDPHTWRDNFLCYREE